MLSAQCVNKGKPVIRFLPLLFATMAVLSPWFIGGNFPFARTSLIGGCIAALLVVLLTLVKDICGGIGKGMSVPWIWWVLLLGVGFTAFQAAPQSSTVQSNFGYKNQSEVNSATSFVSGGDRRQAGNLALEERVRPISIYAPATRSKLVDLLYAVSLFVVASLVLRDSRAVVFTFASLALVGALISFVGVLQILSGDSRVLWQYELLWGGNPFASFVNSNNAAGFLLVCFSASMIFFARTILDNGSADGGESSEFQPLGIKRVLRKVSKLQPLQLYRMTAIVVVAAGIVMTGSRSGMLALAACVVFAGLMLSRSRPWVVFSLTLVLIGCSAAVVGYSEQSERVSSEFQTLANFSEAAAPRLVHWEEAIPFGVANAALGTGNGTYRHVSPLFQRAVTMKTYAHAENVYIETFVEMGFIGVVLLLLCLLYCLYASICLFRRKGLFDQALAVAGVSCLGGQVAIAFLDFGIYQPANCTAMALVMAAVVGRHSTTIEPSSIKPKITFSKWVKLGVVVLLLLALVWAGYESLGIESRRSAKRSIKLLNQYGAEGPSKTRLVSLVTIDKQLKRAEYIRPDDADVQFLFGDLEICQFRLNRAKEVAEDVRKELARIDELDLPPEQRELRRQQLEEIDSEAIWIMTSIPLLHQRLRSAQRNNPAVAEQILGASDVELHLNKSLERFGNSDALSGRLPRVCVRMAQLVAFGTSQAKANTLKEEKSYIDEALSRSTPKTQTLLSCGLLALNSGDQDLAVELWQKCLLQPHLISHERAIVEFSLQMLPMNRFYEEVLPQDPKYLLKIARRYMNKGEMLLPKKFLVVHIRRLVNRAIGLTDLEKNLLLADAARHIDDYPQEVEKYGAALSLAPAKAPWRYDYAFALYKTKQFDEAVRQLKVCELDPSFRKNRIKRLLDRIRKERVNHHAK